MLDDQVADADLDALIQRGDLDGLIRMIDDRCSTHDWAGVLRVRDDSRRAVETGRQLWPAATLAEYRLAWLADPEYVATVLDESDGLSGRFTIGPLTEVAAQHHSWGDLVEHLDRGPRAAFVAHERAIRGEPIETVDLVQVLDIPTTLQTWEPAYALATYADGGAEFPMPDLPDDWSHVTTVAGAEVLDDEVDLAVRQLVEPWLTESNGRAESICVVVTWATPSADSACGERGPASSSRARPSPGWRGRAPMVERMDGAEEPPLAGSAPGGCSLRSATSSTTGRSTPTNLPPSPVT